mmetsp:Transcript_38840/g.99302  ORF Transcript_38840/g.99302 Transcript_38840/m.99302 type:complete len:337 (+) Transcript_38840:250-1260(+)
MERKGGRPPTGKATGEIQAYAGNYYPRVLTIGGEEVVIAEASINGSTGTEMWRVAEHLVRVFEHELEPGMLYGKRAIELGCGCGVLGIAIAVLSQGKAQVILTDHDVRALEMAKLNVELNNLSHCVQVRRLVWGSSVASLVQNGCFDLILGSDIIYHPHCLPELHKTMSELSGPASTILMAHEHRQPALEQRFYTDAAAKHGFKCDRIKRRYLDRREDSSLMSVYQLKKAASRPQSAAPSYNGYRVGMAASQRPSTAASTRPGTAASQRPMSAMPKMVREASSRPSTAASYRRPYSARGSGFDVPARTRKNASEVFSVSYQQLNKSLAAMSSNYGY